MASSPTDRAPSPPHLVSLVLQSKKGLQHGEQLCFRAHDVTYSSAREAVDVLALAAKIRWIATGVLGQLKMAAGVARGIAEQRGRLEEEAKVWDRVRAAHQDALDATLEGLGSQCVPPSFHQSSLESSLFGIQGQDEEEEGEEGTVRRGGGDGVEDRSKWKTLRDFVDERGIEDVLEAVEEERNMLDETLAATAGHPAAISGAVAHIRGMIVRSQEDGDGNGSNGGGGGAGMDLDVGTLLVAQERTSTEMAAHLESLAVHYEQMATALRDREAGETLEEEDMEVFIRDTAELPSIIAELEESISGIESMYHEICEAKRSLQTSLAVQSRALDALDSLGDRMDAMLKEQAGIEMETQATYETLNDYLETLQSLRVTYETYQMSYNALVLEMERRRRYRAAVQSTVEEMRVRLEALRQDEITARDAFHTAHSASIPDDLCLAISNLPQTYVISCGGEGEGGEVLPEIDEDVLVEARRRVDAAAAQAQDVRDALVSPVRPRPRREDSL